VITPKPAGGGAAIKPRHHHGARCSEAVERIRGNGSRIGDPFRWVRAAPSAWEPEGAFEALPPRIDALCPLGAGDALAAAFGSRWTEEIVLRRAALGRGAGTRRQSCRGSASPASNRRKRFISR